MEFAYDSNWTNFTLFFFSYHYFCILALDKVKIIEWNEIEFNNISYTALFGRYFFTSETEISWYINNSLIDPENSYYKLENDGLNSLLRWAVNQPKSNGWYSLKHDLLDLNDSHYVGKLKIMG